MDTRLISSLLLVLFGLGQVATSLDLDFLPREGGVAIRNILSKDQFIF